MYKFFGKDILSMKKLYLALLVVLVLVTSTTNVILVYFYQSVNLDEVKNKYHNIYHIKLIGDKEAVPEFLSYLEDSYKYKIVGVINCGSIKMGEDTYQIAAFTHKNTSKFYQTEKPVEWNDNTVVISQGVPSDIVEKVKFKTKEFCSLIYTGEMSKNVSFVCSPAMFQSKEIVLEEISVEFDKHLNWFQLQQFKKEIGSYFQQYSLGYEGAFSKKALMDMKNIFIISLLVILYTAISTFGIYDFLIKEQKRTLGIYLVCGLSPKVLRRLFIMLIFIINCISIGISIPITIIIRMINNMKLEGELGFLPYFMTTCIMFFVSFVLTFYSTNSILKKDVCIEKRQ